MANETNNRAMLNNIKHDKHDKDIKTIKDITGSDYQQIDAIAPLGETSSLDSSLSQKACRGNGSGAPKSPVIYMKLDLFDNALGNSQSKLHVKLNVKLQDDANWHSYGAGLNCQRRMAKRGLDMDKPKERQHWDLLEELALEMAGIYQDIRISKFYIAGNQKGNTVKRLSIVLGKKRQDGEYYGVVVRGTTLNEFNLSAKGLTTAQRRQHVIASADWTNGATQKKTSYDIDDLMGE